MSGLDDILGGLLGGKDGSAGGSGGLDDLLSGVLGGKGGGLSIGAFLPVLMGLLSGGGLNKLLSGLQQQGLSSQVASWEGTGENESVTGDQIRAALGDEQLAEIAQKLGVSEGEASDALAEVVPRVVDRVSPDGTLPASSDLDRLFKSVQRRATS